MNKALYNVINHNEWDDLVWDTYGKRDYSVVAEEEARNYTCLCEPDIEKEEMDEGRMRSLADWISGKRKQAPGLWCLMTDMANNGILEPGNYLIVISW